MNRYLLPVALLALTVGAVVYLPKGFTSGNLLDPDAGTSPDPVVDIRPELPAPRVEVVFALDTTGSMSGLIQTAKDKIWSIANSMASADPAPEIAIGLVAYRDRGDDYVTRVFDLNTDLDAVYAQLLAFQAGGGGDGPESVNKALDDALHQMSWSKDGDAYQTLFLVGDAPAHMDYQDERQFPELARIAAERDIVINTIRCGKNSAAAKQWQQIAGLTQGRFFTVTQNGGALAIATPFDQKMAELSTQLDDTRLHYGSRAEREAGLKKKAGILALYSDAPAATVARRSAFNLSESGSKQMFRDKDLLADLASGKVALDAIQEDELPEALKTKPAAERPAAIAELNAEREQVTAALKDLARQRDEYLATESSKVEAVEESLDYQLFEAVKGQAEARGLVYSTDTPKL